MKHQIQVKVNGQAYTFDVYHWQTLLEVLRENLKLIKTKEGCGVGECGSCAVIMNTKGWLRMWSTILSMKP
jgi:xanthine dehydrogenase YagT iron-sulfur-binding subunit